MHWWSPLYLLRNSPIRSHVPTAEDDLDASLLWRPRPPITPMLCRCRRRTARAALLVPLVAWCVTLLHAGVDSVVAVERQACLCMRWYLCVRATGSVLGLAYDVIHVMHDLLGRATQQCFISGLLGRHPLAWLAVSSCHIITQAVSGDTAARSTQAGLGSGALAAASSLPAAVADSLPAAAATEGQMDDMATASPADVRVRASSARPSPSRSPEVPAAAEVRRGRGGASPSGPTTHGRDPTLLKRSVRLVRPCSCQGPHAVGQWAPWPPGPTLALGAQLGRACCTPSLREPPCGQPMMIGVMHHAHLLFCACRAVARTTCANQLIRHPSRRRNKPWVMRYVPCSALQVPTNSALHLQRMGCCWRRAHPPSA